MSAKGGWSAARRRTRGPPGLRPHPANASRATIAALNASGTVTSGSDTTSSARLRARKLKQALSAATTLPLATTKSGLLGLGAALAPGGAAR